MIDLYYWPTPNGHKITMFFEELDIDYKIVPVDISAGVETDRWRAVAYFDNVFDEAYWLSNFTGSRLRGTAVIVVPRTFGVRFTYKLGDP